MHINPSFHISLRQEWTWSPNPTDGGDEPGWKNVVINLGGLGLNGQSTVYFRWVFSADNFPFSEGPGFYIDDIDIGY